MNKQHLYIIEHNEGQLYMQGGLNGVIARCEELKREGKTNIMLFREKHNKGILYREQIQLYETYDIPEKYDGWFKGDKYL